MTEQEWNTSSDPFKMMRAVNHGNTRILTEKICQDYCRACCWLVSQDLGQEASILIRELKRQENKAINWAMAWSGDQNKPNETERANLLRCVIGSPWRKYLIAEWAMNPEAFGFTHVFNKKWITEQIRILLPNTMKQDCERCNGQGWRREGIWAPSGRGVTGFQNKKCYKCDGEKEFSTPFYDNDRLAILSDALEEAGCTDSNVLDHLRNGKTHVQGCWVIKLLEQ